MSAETFDNSLEILLVVLCGIPASGKSHLSRLIGENYANNVNCATIVVCYDLLIPQQLITQTQDRDLTSSKSSLWKQYRESIVKVVEVLVAEMLNNNSDPDEVYYRKLYADVDSINPDAIRHQVEETLRKENHWSFSQMSRKKECEIQRVIFIIDDNMYFKSMRYDYYRLARKYHISFCQIHVECDIGTALQRNRSRSFECAASSCDTANGIDEDIIRNMFDKFEKPKKPWELKSLILHNNRDDHFKSCISSVLSFLNASFTCRAPSLVDDYDDDREQNALSRLGCRRSILHRVDRELRKLVSKEANIKSDSLKFKMERLNTARRQIMDDFRNGVLVLDEDLQHRIGVGEEGDEISDRISQELSYVLQIKLKDNI